MVYWCFRLFRNMQNFLLFIFFANNGLHYNIRRTPFAASTPRLGTDCSLNFAGHGVSPCYITRAELAHSILYAPHRVTFILYIPIRTRAFWVYVPKPSTATGWVIVLTYPKITVIADTIKNSVTVT
jgi:hypothetical protein